MKKGRPKAPWFIWLSFLGLTFLHGKRSVQYLAGKPTYTGKEFDRHCGYTVRLIGLFIGVFGIPTLLMEYLNSLMLEMSLKAGEHMKHSIIAY